MLVVVALERICALANVLSNAWTVTPSLAATAAAPGLRSSQWRATSCTRISRSFWCDQAAPGCGSPPDAVGDGPTVACHRPLSQPSVPRSPQFKSLRAVQTSADLLIVYFDQTGKNVRALSAPATPPRRNNAPDCVPACLTALGCAPARDCRRSPRCSGSRLSECSEASRPSPSLGFRRDPGSKALFPSSGVHPQQLPSMNRHRRPRAAGGALAACDRAQRPEELVQQDPQEQNLGLLKALCLAGGFIRTRRPQECSQKTRRLDAR